MSRAKEQMFFTAFIGLVMLAALFVAKDWPVRASIIILLVGKHRGRARLATTAARF